MYLPTYLPTIVPLGSLPPSIHLSPPVTYGGASLSQLMFVHSKWLPTVPSQAVRDSPASQLVCGMMGLSPALDDDDDDGIKIQSGVCGCCCCCCSWRQRWRLGITRNVVECGRWWWRWSTFNVFPVRFQSISHVLCDHVYLDYATVCLRVRPCHVVVVVCRGGRTEARKCNSILFPHTSS